MVSIRSMPSRLYLLAFLQTGYLLKLRLRTAAEEGGCLPQATEEFQRAGIELRSQPWPEKSRQRNAALHLEDAPSSSHLTRGALQGGAARVEIGLRSRPGLKLVANRIAGERAGGALPPADHRSFAECDHSRAAGRGADRPTLRDAPVTMVVLPERLIVIVDLHLRHPCEVSPQSRWTNQRPSIRFAF